MPPPTLLCVFISAARQKKDQSRKNHKCNFEAAQGWVSVPLLHECSLWGSYPLFFMGPHSYSFWGCNKRAVRVGPWQKIEFLFNTKKVFDFPQTEGDFHSYLALAGEAQGERDMHCPGYYSLLVTKVCVISDGTGIKIPLKLIFLGCITKCV